MPNSGADKHSNEKTRFAHDSGNDVNFLVRSTIAILP